VFLNLQFINQRVSKSNQSYCSLSYLITCWQQPNYKTQVFNHS